MSPLRGSGTIMGRFGTTDMSPLRGSGFPVQFRAINISSQFGYKHIAATRIQTYRRNVDTNISPQRGSGTIMGCFGTTDITPPGLMISGTVSCNKHIVATWIQTYRRNAAQEQLWDVSVLQACRPSGAQVFRYSFVQQTYRRYAAQE